MQPVSLLSGFDVKTSGSRTYLPKKLV